MPNQEHKEIWRDPATGLPMHSHSRSVPIKDKNGGILITQASENAAPCDCGISAYDYPLSAKPTPKGDH